MIKGPVGHKICCILGEMGVLSAIVRLEITMGLKSVLMIFQVMIWGLSASKI
jgi:hypothetical protein